MMKCPECCGDDIGVKDSRNREGGASVARRRQCFECGHKFSTVEISRSKHRQLIRLQAKAILLSKQAKRLSESLTKAMDVND